MTTTALTWICLALAFGWVILFIQNWKLLTQQHSYQVELLNRLSQLEAMLRNLGNSNGQPGGYKLPPHIPSGEATHTQN